MTADYSAAPRRFLSFADQAAADAAAASLPDGRIVWAESEGTVGVVEGGVVSWSGGSGGDVVEIDDWDARPITGLSDGDKAVYTPTGLGLTWSATVGEWLRYSLGTPVLEAQLSGDQLPSAQGWTHGGTIAPTTSEGWVVFDGSAANADTSNAQIAQGVFTASRALIAQTRTTITSTSTSNHARCGFEGTSGNLCNVDLSGGGSGSGGNLRLSGTSSTAVGNALKAVAAGGEHYVEIWVLLATTGTLITMVFVDHAVSPTLYDEGAPGTNTWTGYSLGKMGVASRFKVEVKDAKGFRFASAA